LLQSTAQLADNLQLLWSHNYKKVSQEISTG